MTGNDRVMLNGRRGAVNILPVLQRPCLWMWPRSCIQGQDYHFFHRHLLRQIRRKPRLILASSLHGLVETVPLASECRALAQLRIRTDRSTQQQRIDQLKLSISGLCESISIHFLAKFDYLCSTTIRTTHR